jgi:uncharacterized protein YecE (DUF72 family)
MTLTGTAARRGSDLDASNGPHDPGFRTASARSAGLDEAAAHPIPAPDGGFVRVGTASWTDPTMTAAGVFYPSDADTAEERLQYYASQFPLVEVDATYYALPARRMSELWLDRTPPDFTFDVKAHALMTGQPSEVRRLPKTLRNELPADLAGKGRIYARDLPKELEEEIWAIFRDALEPLREHGQLGSVLLQYPRWFFPPAENREAIVRARERLAGIACAVEFRSGTWFNEKNRERTLRFLEDNGVPFVMVDGPQGFRSSIPPIVAVTSPELALVRFHGRRTETWEKPNVPTVERFRYLYDRDELGEWVPRIREAATRARETHVLMNNCYANYGATNAREIAALLQDLELPGDGAVAERQSEEARDELETTTAPPGRASSGAG